MSTYNGEKFLRQQMESLLNQTYKNIEIYVRDDGSKDNTPKILKEYEDQGKIHFIKGKNVAKKIQKNIFVKKGENSKSKKAMK